MVKWEFKQRKASNPRVGTPAQREKSLLGNQVNRKWRTGEQENRGTQDKPHSEARSFDSAYGLAQDDKGGW